MRALLAGLALLLVTAAPAAAADRFALHGQCLTVRPADGPVRLQATTLARYLLMRQDGTFVTGGAPAAQPGPEGDFRVTDAEDGALRFTRIDGKALGTFTPAPAEGCATFPELEVNVTGTPYQGPTSFGETKGLIETHLHGMAFEFLGGSVHCGRPWHPYGVTKALVDCPDHGPTGTTGTLETAQSGSATHAPDGWPSFRGWPTFRSYTHEQAYFKWLERAWRGGLRLYTNLLVDNEVLCEVYPLKRNRCDEMESIRIQRARLDELVDYVDAQSGGPGKGWLRIVRDPFEARRVINEGKLALVVGIETSKLFNCGEVNGRPTCDRASIDRQLDEVHAMGVRQMQLVNKNDNAFVGVAGDAGSTGVLTNTANRYDTGHFWAMQTCTGPDPEHEHDREQLTPGGAADRDELAGAIISAFAPPDAAPVYPSGPHCNLRGLTDLGAYLVRRMMDKNMLLDPDHMSVRGRAETLSIIEAARYGGILSSHSWSTPEAYRRILAMGGLVTPAPKTSEGFIRDWTTLRKAANPRFLFGTGFSTDINGFASQGGPRQGMDVKYPFTSLDGSTTIDRQVSGTRTYDINKDGTAHFGLYPDRIEDIATLGGPVVEQDLLNGAEAYLQMWERAEGVPAPQCRAAQRRLTSKGFGEIRLGQDPEGLLRSAGQPQRRAGRTFTWCANGTKGGQASALLTPEGRVELVGSTARLHRFAGIGAGSRASALGRRARVAGPGLRAREAGRGRVAVFGVRRGRITFAAVTTRAVAADRTRLARAVKAAGLR